MTTTVTTLQHALAAEKADADALALGAEGIGIGTRLSMSKESPVNSKTLDAQIEAGIEDTIYSHRFNGLNCRVLKTPAAEKAISRGRNLPKGLIASFAIAKCLDLSLTGRATSILSGKGKEKSASVPAPAEARKKKKSMSQGLLQGPKMGMNLAHKAAAHVAIQKAAQEGDLDHGVQLVGQVQGIIHYLPPVAEIIRGTVKEAREIGKTINLKMK